MKKKMLALLLCATMVMGLSLTASAEEAAANEDGTYGAQIEGSAEVQQPTISVEVPAELGDLILNPYKVPFEVDDPEGGEDPIEVTDQIFSAENLITSKSNVPLSVDITDLLGAAGEGSGVVFATAALKGTETTKSVYAFIEVVEGEDGEFTGTYDAKATNMALIGTKAVAKTGVATLDAVEDLEGEEVSTVKIKVFGSAATTPAKPWASADTFKVSMKFTFTPKAAEASTGA